MNYVLRKKYSLLLLSFDKMRDSVTKVGDHYKIVTFKLKLQNRSLLSKTIDKINTNLYFVQN